MVLVVGCGSEEEEQEVQEVQDITIEETVETEETENAEEQEVEAEEAEKSEVQEVEAEETEEAEETGKADVVKVQKMIDDAEAEAAALEKKLAEDASLTQADMNELSYEIYTVWDDVLNDVWGILKDTLDEEAMNDLLEEQREWIADKEAKAQEAGAEFAGGSMEAMVVNMKASELTKERVYDLVEYL